MEFESSFWRTKTMATIQNDNYVTYRIRNMSIITRMLRNWNVNHLYDAWNMFFVLHSLHVLDSTIQTSYIPNIMKLTQGEKLCRTCTRRAQPPTDDVVVDLVVHTNAAGTGRKCPSTDNTAVPPDKWRTPQMKRKEEKHTHDKRCVHQCDVLPKRVRQLATGTSFEGRVGHRTMFGAKFGGPGPYGR